MGYSVPLEEAAKFAQVWHDKGGVVIPMQDVHIRFARDFANVVLKNFIEMCAAKTKQKGAAGVAQKAEEKPSGLIITG